MVNHDRVFKHFEPFLLKKIFFLDIPCGVRGQLQL